MLSLTVIVLGCNAACISALGPYLPAFFGYFIASLGPLACAYLARPDTDAIDPLTSSSPLTFTGATDAAAAADVVAGALDCALGEFMLDSPHATADSAVIPTIATTE